MNILLIILAILLVSFGLIGAIVPGIAGPPFSFLGLLVLSFVNRIDYSNRFLVIMGMVAAVVFALDYVVPSWGTKKFGGSKAGVRGSAIGLFVSLLITLLFPVGFVVVLLGPFIGAYLGEKLVGTDDHKAWKSAFGSFIGFLFGTGLKMIYAFVCIYIVIRDLIKLL